MGNRVFFKEVEDFEKEREESGEGEVFKNNVRSLKKKKRKGFFLKVCRKERFFFLKVGKKRRFFWKVCRKRRGLLKNGGGEILVKRVDHFINCRREAYSGMIMTDSSLFFNIMEFFLFSCHLWVSLLWSECGYLACLISVDL